MRMLAVLMLSVVIVLHHGVPVLGHQAHVQGPAPCAAADCGGASHAGHGDEPTGDHSAAIGACLAVIAMAGGLAIAFAARRRPVAWRAVPRGWHGLRLRGMLVAPPPHGPPRPLRPCVLQR